MNEHTNSVLWHMHEAILKLKQAKEFLSDAGVMNRVQRQITQSIENIAEEMDIVLHNCEDSE